MWKPAREVWIVIWTARGTRFTGTSKWPQVCLLTLPLVLCALLVSPAVAEKPTREGFSFGATDDRLCDFPLEVTVSGEGQHHIQTREGELAREFFTGPARVELHDPEIGTNATLQTPGPAFFDLDEGTGMFRGAVVGIYGPGIPLLAMRGQTTFRLQDFRIVHESGRDAIIDPCDVLRPEGAAPSTPRTTPPPWEAEEHALAQMDTAGLLPAFFSYQRHIHAHLDVIIHGTGITVPAGIGIVEPVVDPAGDVVSALDAAAPLHTHTSDGIVHLEADREPLELTLGQFFDMWNVRLNPDCIGSYCAEASSSVRVYVNGILEPGDPRSVRIASFDEIAVVFGPTGVPAEIPSAYEFPPEDS